MNDDDAQPRLIAVLADSMRRHASIDDYDLRADAVIRDLAAASQEMEESNAQQPSAPCQRVRTARTPPRPQAS